MKMSIMMFSGLRPFFEVIDEINSIVGGKVNANVVEQTDPINAMIS